MIHLLPTWKGEIKLIIQNVYKKIKNKFILYIYIYMHLAR
jgi:hypothetical protein